jgi:hypothetical protein
MRRIWEEMDHDTQERKNDSSAEVHYRPLPLISTSRRSFALSLEETTFTTTAID